MLNFFCLLHRQIIEEHFMSIAHEGYHDCHPVLGVENGGEAGNLIVFTVQQY